MATLEEWLERKLDRAKEHTDETHRAAPNSWGSGYDRGFYDALQEIFSQIPRAVALTPMEDPDA